MINNFLKSNDRLLKLIEGYSQENIYDNIDQSYRSLPLKSVIT